MIDCLLDGEKIESKEALHSAIARTLPFPDCYGMNLDALLDCLTELSQEVHVWLFHRAALEASLGGYAGRLLKALRQAAQENPHVHVTVGRRPVSLDTWPRADVFRFFSGMSHPFFSVTFTVDVTNLYNFTKARQISFYYALVYLCTRAVNGVEAFRYCLENGRLVLLDQRNPSFTDLKKGSELFHIVTIPYGGEIVPFCRAAKEKSMAQTEFISMAAETSDLIYFSCLPWVELTALTNERNLDPDDAIPRIAWGKYTEEKGRKRLNLSIELNHRFTDGLHVGKFYEALAAYIASL